ncbi:MAG TPA: hypothetical protein VMS31_05650, partial [Pyrinomonadaceae bacterium]|nr:hypothetical protein [Pyrinomonadaceae bacterium]
MSKEIWLGPLLGNNRSRLIERCADLVAQGKGDTFLYLAASHPLLELVTEQILDGARNRGLWGELPVYLFRGFVRQVLSKAVDEQTGERLPPRVPIDREELPLKRSLVSQILSRLAAAGQLKAIGPLAHREGCVNTIATLMGEIERAAKSPAEVATIVATRRSDLAHDRGKTPAGTASELVHSQVDFDEEVALIYKTYSELLNRHQLTEADADQLRALQVLSGELDGRNWKVSSLSQVQLLVLDGFFDFTPVQGEILQRLIPRIPEVVVNLNHDERNQEIFLPFEETIDRLSAIAPFTQKRSTAVFPTLGALSELRERLFNPSVSDKVSDTLQFVADVPDKAPATSPAPAPTEQAATKQSEIRYFECGDRDTEIRAIAKEIKRLVVREGYRLVDIALVVRQRASYAETIARVMREEQLPCNLEWRVEANDIPGLRAALKLFDILEQLSTDPAPPRISQLADLIKSEYFRLNDQELNALSVRFDAEYAGLLRETDAHGSAEEEARRKKRYRIGVWDADALENAFAYVGSELRVSDWLTRAGKLIKELPGAEATRELLNIDSAEQARDPDEADQIENAETAKVDSTEVERKRRPSRDIHPATLAWTSLVIQAFAQSIQAVDRQGSPAYLRLQLMGLLEQLNFRHQITGPTRNAVEDEDLPQVMLNYHSLEALRRAFAATIKSMEVSEPPALAGGVAVAGARPAGPSGGVAMSEPPASAGGVA